MCVIKSKAKWATGDTYSDSFTPRIQIDFKDIMTKFDAIREYGLEPIKIIIELPKGDMAYGIPVEWGAEE